MVDDSELSQLLHLAYASRLAEAASTLRLIKQVSQPASLKADEIGCEVPPLRRGRTVR